MTHLVIPLTGSNMSDWNGFRVISAQAPQEEKQEGKGLIDTLKDLLASAYVLYHTAHGFHWNMKGPDFYEYHKLFLEIYEDIYESVDPIAENIVKLGGDAPFAMGQLVTSSKVKETNEAPKELKELVQKFQEMNGEFIPQLKSSFIIANDSNEQGIANFIAERIDQHQKWNWFLKASLGKK